jgi:hypothetical protein
MKKMPVKKATVKKATKKVVKKTDEVKARKVAKITLNPN